MTYSELISRLTKLRGKTTQTQLGKKVGLARQTISNIENHRQALAAEDMLKWIAACGLTPAEFFESNIPKEYDDPAHADLHRRIQDMLDAGNADLIKQIFGNIRQLEALMRDKRGRASPRARDAERARNPRTAG